MKFVDGHEMAKLMMRYGLGVTKTSVHVANIDRDYFEGLGHFEIMPATLQLPWLFRFLGKI